MIMTSKPTPNEKLTILCLHGWGTNPKFMRYQMRSFAEVYQNINFQYLQGPFKIAENLIMDEKVVQLIPEKEYYGWRSNLTDTIFTKDKTGFEESIDSICEYINNNGPVDGILGFSQGAACAMQFVCALENGSLKGKLKKSPPVFVILVSPPAAKTTQFLKMTSIHLVGKKDFLFSGGIFNTTRFLNPIVILHGETHKFPKLSYEMIEKMNQVFKPVLAMKKMRKGPLENIRPNL